MRDGWVGTTLGEIAEVNPENTPKWDSDHAIRYLDIASVSWGQPLPDDILPQPFGQAPGRARRRIRSGDIVVSTVRPNLRAMGVVPKHLDGAVASTGFTVLRARDRVSLPGFLWALVSHQAFTDSMVRKATGSNYPAIRPTDVASYRLNLPPLEEQQRIVDLIDALDGAIAAAGDAQEAAFALFTRVRRQAMSTVEKRVPLGDVAQIQLGRMLSKERSVGAEQAPYIRNANVQWEGLDLSDLKTMSFPLRDRPRYALFAGDILVCEGGDPGRAVLLRQDLPGVFYQKAVHRVRTTEVDPVFLYHALGEAYAEGSIRDLCTVTTIAHLTAEKFRRLLVPIPNSSDAQRDIAALLDGVLDNVRAHDAAVAAMKDLRSNLLTVLLSGEHEIPESYDATISGLVATGV